MGSTIFSPFTTSVCYTHTMRNMYHFLIALIRKLCAVVRPRFNWSSHSSIARFLNRLGSFILRVSRPLTSTSQVNDRGNPHPAILLPSDAASIELCNVGPSPKEIEEGLPVPVIDLNSIKEPRQADPPPGVVKDNDEEHGLLPPELRPSPTTIFVPIFPTQSDRYDQKIIMCVFPISNI